MTQEPQKDALQEQEELQEPQVKAPQPVVKKNQAIEELKHSVLLHVSIMNGPSSQLAALLLKVIDFIEDVDIKRRDSELLKLYIIVEAIAIFVQKSIDDRAEKAEKQGIVFPPKIKQSGDNILIMVGKTRSHDNKVEAKNAVLCSIADALRDLSTFTKAKYPTITDCQRREL